MQNKKILAALFLTPVFLSAGTAQKYSAPSSSVLASSSSVTPTLFCLGSCNAPTPVPVASDSPIPSVTAVPTENQISPTANPCPSGTNSAEANRSQKVKKSPDFINGFIQWLLQLLQRLLDLLLRLIGQKPVTPPTLRVIPSPTPTGDNITPVPTLTLCLTPTPGISVIPTPTLFQPTSGPTSNPSTAPTTPVSQSNVKWAGVRASEYGIDPFPSEAGWTNAATTMSGYFPDSTPVAVWLTGSEKFNGSKSGQKFNFPNPGGTWDNKIYFDSTDGNESFLAYFDTHGIKVFLQVEPGFSPMNQLFDIMYRKYGRHPSVIGFGVDVEWYQSSCDGCANAKVADSLAQTWESKIKSLNPNYRLFLKHFDTSDLPPTYRGNIIFINDSQGFSNLNNFLRDMKSFADFFYPNPVMYQIGYEADKKWWKNLKSPIPQTLGKALSAQTKSRQTAGVVWVDFSLRDVLPTN